MKKLMVLAIFLTLGIATPTGGAFKATPPILQKVLSRITEQAAATKTYLVTQRAAMVVSTVSATVPLAVIQHLATVIPQLTTLVTTPGLAAYAKAQSNDATYEVVTEFNAMRALMVSTLANLITMFPKDGSGFLLYQTLDVNGVISIRTFTSVQVAPAVALMDTLIASIE